MGASPPNLSLLFPDIAAQQANLDRQQKIADFLTQQGQQPLEVTRTIGGIGVPISPFEGLNKLAEIKSGNYQTQQLMNKQLDIAKQQNGMIGGLFGAGPQGASPAGGGDMPIQSASPQASVTPGGMPQQPMGGSAPMVLPGYTPQQSMALYALDPQTYMSERLKALAPTEQMRRDNELGYDVATQRQFDEAGRAKDTGLPGSILQPGPNGPTATPIPGAADVLRQNAIAGAAGGLTNATINGRTAPIPNSYLLNNPQFNGQPKAAPPSAPGQSAADIFGDSPPGSAATNQPTQQAGQVAAIAAGTPPQPVIGSAPGETAYDTKRGEDYAKAAQVYQDNGRAANETLGNLGLFKSINSNPNIPQGELADHIQGIKSMASSLGIPTKGVAAGEMVETLSNKIALQARSALGSNIAIRNQREFNTILDQGPTLSKTQVGREVLADTIQRASERVLHVSNMANAYEQEHGRIDQGFDKLIHDTYDSQPLFSPQEQSAIDAKLQATNNGASAPQGAHPQDIVDELRKRGVVK